MITELENENKSEDYESNSIDEDKDLVPIKANKKSSDVVLLNSKFSNDDKDDLYLSLNKIVSNDTEEYGDVYSPLKEGIYIKMIKIDDTGRANTSIMRPRIRDIDIFAGISDFKKP